MDSKNIRLSNVSDWEKIYKQPENITIKKVKFYKKLFYFFTKNYSDSLLWEVLYPKYFTRSDKKKIIEIGSAPGRNLIKWNELFGYEPYGVEYTGNGLKINRALFKQYQLNEENIIHSDFFATEFQSKYSNSFDIVCSYGFIEHFDNVKDVVQKHLNLLKPEGILVITVPNLQGIYLNLLKLINKDIIEIHNLSIMNLPAFQELFDSNQLEYLYCDYYGIFNLNLLNYGNGFFRRVIRLLGTYSQFFLNGIFRVFLRKRGKESRYFSPYLVFIGKKKTY